MKINLYPEYFEGKITGDSIEIVGEYTRSKRSRMCLYEDGKLFFSYEKMKSDKVKNIAGSENQKIEVFIKSDVAIGLVCCMDIGNPLLLGKVKEKLQKSKCKYKIIAISAYMTNDWFTGEIISNGDHEFHGYIVALSNGNSSGVKSFITDTCGRKLNALDFENETFQISIKGIT